MSAIVIEHIPKCYAFQNDFVLVTICDLIKYQSKDVNEAAEIVIEKLRSIGADGGVIVLDSEGNVAMTFNTPAMARAYKNSKGEQLVKIYRDWKPFLSNTY